LAGAECQQRRLGLRHTFARQSARLDDRADRTIGGRPSGQRGERRRGLAHRRPSRHGAVPSASRGATLQVASLAFGSARVTLIAPAL